VTDKQFMGVFIGVLGFLVALAVVIFFIAQGLSPEAGDLKDPLVRKAVEKRLEPVGGVYVGAVPEPAAGEEAAPAAEAGPALADGKSVYDAVCAGCHGTGAAGAPKLGDAAAWGPRLGGGSEPLYQAATAGKGAMPPKGGRPDLSDEQIRMAVDYMVQAVQ
jgi:cytochrome c5